jgi:hypothetical protein
MIVPEAGGGGAPPPVGGGGVVEPPDEFTVKSAVEEKLLSVVPALARTRQK